MIAGAGPLGFSDMCCIGEPRAKSFFITIHYKGLYFYAWGPSCEGPLWDMTQGPRLQPSPPSPEPNAWYE